MIPVLNNVGKIVQYILIWVIYAIVQVIAFSQIVEFPEWVIVLDGFIHATIFGVLGILLWSVIQYGNYSILNRYQRMINYIALGLLSVLLWSGIGFGTFNLLFGENYNAQLIQLLPLRGLIGTLIFLILAQYFRVSIEPKNEENELSETEENISETVDSQEEILERITVKSGTKIHVVLISEIVYLQADGDYVQIVTTDRKYLKEQTMKYFEEHLPHNLFVRVHRSSIVNVEMISRIELYEKQNQLLTLKNGHQIKTSPTGYKSLRAVLKL